jgi:DNA invertase Pin-like site-specific DNA recombinase
MASWEEWWGALEKRITSDTIRGEDYVQNSQPAIAVFTEFERDVIRERIKAGITDARKRGKAHGRPRAIANDAAQMRALAQQSLRQAAIARHLGLWRTSVRRVLAQQEGT